MNEEGAADFARRFAEYWKAPTPCRPRHGPGGVGSASRADDAGHWGATDDGVLIEFTLSGSAGVRSRIGS